VKHLCFASCSRYDNNLTSQKQHEIILLLAVNRFMSMKDLTSLDEDWSQKAKKTTPNLCQPLEIRLILGKSKA
jgi:hypothetical protein